MVKKIEMSKFHEIELEKSFELIQTSQNLRIQVSIFFATVNLGALSFGISQEKAVLFIFAALLFGVMMVIDYAIRAILAHAYYRVIRIHKYYVIGDITFSPNINSGLAREVIKIVAMKNESEQMMALRKTLFRVKNLYGFWLPALASLVEIASGIFLWKVLGWTLI